MIYLMQILRIVEDLNLFEAMFEDLDFEIEEMGYSGHEEELVYEMLDNHFGIEMTEEKQIKSLTSCIRGKGFKSAVHVEKLRRGML